MSYSLTPSSALEGWFVGTESQTPHLVVTALRWIPRKMYSGTDSLADLIATRECCELQGVRDPSGHWHRTALNLETLSAFLSIVTVLIPP